MAEKTVRTTFDLIEVLKGVTFVKSCIDFNWKFQIESVYGYSPSNGEFYHKGWLVNTTFRRPDTNTGIIGEGKGRQEFLPIGITESGIVKTCLLLCKLITDHEVMEAILYKGYRPFDPHNSVDELTACQKAKRKPIEEKKSKRKILKADERIQVIA